MIFYFTGTGNSWEVAQNIAKELNDKLVSISNAMINCKFTYDLKNNERIGFVFPCHAWGPPKIVLEFVKKLNLKNYGNNYLYFIFTCEIDIGYSDVILTRILRKKNIKYNAGFSFIMPNNYILFWGYEVDKQSLKDLKYQNINILYQMVNSAIRERRSLFIFKRGKFPFLKTYLIRYIFYLYQFNPQKFYAQETCISCGLCERTCPMHNITISSHKPVWGEKCSLCLACIHICPYRAIQFGKITLNKGRYFNVKYRKFRINKMTDYF